MADLETPNFTYSRNEYNAVVRNDNVLVPEHEPDNACFKLYQQWLAEGNEPPPQAPQRRTANITEDDVARSFTYRRDQRNLLIRNDNVVVPEDDPNNACFKFYQLWLAAGNEPPPMRQRKHEHGILSIWRRR